MNRPLLKISLKIGLATASLIVLYELSDLLLNYHYFKFEYYIAGAVVIALITGIVLTRRFYWEKMPDMDAPNPLEALTAKELRVLELIAAGKSNKEIASLNYTEISTVKTHINNIFFKLGVKSRKDAAKVFHRQAETQKSIFSPPATI